MGVNGKVYLVGAGPGDPGLLTCRGAELIALADVIISDALVSPALLALVPKSTEIIFAGKRSRLHAIPQDELNSLLIDHAKAGKVVVRLKGGIPSCLDGEGKRLKHWLCLRSHSKLCPGSPQLVQFLHMLEFQQHIGNTVLASQF